MANSFNYGGGLQPRLLNEPERATQSFVGKSSSAIYVGGIVPFTQGTTAAPDGIEYGVPAFAAGDYQFGIVQKVTRQGSDLPIQDDPMYAGTITNGTATAPMKYTFSATNDRGSSSTPKNELLHIQPIKNGDVVEMLLGDGSGNIVARGTTVAEGSADSSANFGIGLDQDINYPWMLIEQSGDKDLDGKEWYTVSISGRAPTNRNKVYVTPIRTFTAFAESTT